MKILNILFKFKNFQRYKLDSPNGKKNQVQPQNVKNQVQINRGQEGETRTHHCSFLMVKKRLARFSKIPEGRRNILVLGRKSKLQKC